MVITWQAVNDFNNKHIKKINGREPYKYDGVEPLKRFLMNDFEVSSVPLSKSLQLTVGQIKTEEKCVSRQRTVALGEDCLKCRNNGL